MWRWDVREVPAADSGRTYETIEERCRACEVNGGPEGMCIDEAQSRRLQAKHDRPCPRVELDPRNFEAMDLIGWLIHEDLRALVPQYADALLADCEPIDRGAILERVGLAMRSRELIQRLHPEAMKD